MESYVAVVVYTRCFDVYNAAAYPPYKTVQCDDKCAREYVLCVCACT